MTLHELLDLHYGADGTDVLRAMLADGADPNRREGTLSETPLHVATRRRRLIAVEMLLDRGADIDAHNGGRKTAHAHALRRGFDEIATVLRLRGTSTLLNEPDRLATAVVTGQLEAARAILGAHPGAVRTGNTEEDRLLADIAGRNDTEPVELLIGAGADLEARGLDDGTPLHQAAWFGQPANANLLIEAGALSTSLMLLMRARHSVGPCTVPATRVAQRSVRTSTSRWSGRCSQPVPACTTSASRRPTGTSSGC